VSDNLVRLKYFGLSQGEVEVLFNMLSNPFDVSEEAIEEIDESYVSMISVDLPIAYGKTFFKTFGMDRWEGIKEVLKNLKWRRGKKGFQLSLRFNGNPAVAFSLNTDDNKTFGKALETIEYLMDVILFQIDSKRLPSDVSEVSYEFDRENFRWYPAKALGNNAEYHYVNDEWMIQQQE
jgi:hypothetical protein